MPVEAQLSIAPTKSRNLGSPSSVTGKPGLSHHIVLWREAGKHIVSVPQRLQEPKLTQKV